MEQNKLSKCAAQGIAAIVDALKEKKLNSETSEKDTRFILRSTHVEIEGRVLVMSVKTTLLPDGKEHKPAKTGIKITMAGNVEQDMTEGQIAEALEAAVLSIIDDGKPWPKIAPNIKVLGARLLVLQDKAAEETISGIILPEKVTEQAKPLTGTVLCTGPGFWSMEGERIPTDIKVGDKIIWTNLGGVPINVDGTSYLVINENHVLAVIGKEEVLPYA